MKVTLVGSHEARTSFRAPYFLSRVPAGFPSPADDYMDKRLDLNEYLIKHPAATFYCRASGVSLVGRGIFDGDLLVVDRALEPRHDDIVVASLDGELTCKILNKHERCLSAANPDYPAIPINDDASLIIEGVVINSIRHHRVRSS